TLTPEHPRMQLHTKRVADLESQVVEEFRHVNRAQAVEYGLQEVIASARYQGYTRVAEEMEAKLRRYPAYERELVDLYREHKLQRALLLKMEELNDMAISMLEKEEEILRPLDPPSAELKPTEPNVALLGAGLFVSGTLAAMGWLALRDRLGQ
ncbi:MAG TPA: hypothetical protein VEI97_18545, partial [bacterium]|nr:hypothetical protein [bacterium]